MDWVPEPEKMMEGELEAPDSVAEPDATVDQATAFSVLPGATSRTGRRISHKKSASDTFAFAAGLFQQEDFYNLLEVPIDAIERNRGTIASGFDLHSASSSGLLPADVRVDVGADTADGIAQTHNTIPCSSSHAADASMHAVLPATVPTKAAASVKAAGKASKAAKAAAVAAAAAAVCAEEEAEAEAAAAAAGTQTRANALDTSTLDPRRAKRILANRQSAQRSRMKRLHYIHDLENKSAAAAGSVKELSTEVDCLGEQQRILAEAVEDGKTKVAGLMEQLTYEQALQSTLQHHISALRARVAMAQQSNGPVHAQQQLPVLPVVHQLQQQGAYQSKPEQQVLVEAKPGVHAAAAPGNHVQQQQPRTAFGAGPGQQQPGYCEQLGTQQQQRQSGKQLSPLCLQGAGSATMTGGSPGIPVSQMHAMAIGPPPLAEASGAAHGSLPTWQERLQQQASAEEIAAAASQELVKRTQQHLITSQQQGPGAPGLHSLAGSFDFQLQQQQQQQVPAVPDIQDVNMDESAANVPVTGSSCDEAGGVARIAIVPAPLLRSVTPSKPGGTPDFNTLGLASTPSAGDGGMLAGLNGDDDLEGLLQADQSFMGEGPLYSGGELAALRDELAMGSLMDLRKTSSM